MSFLTGYAQDKENWQVKKLISMSVLMSVLSIVVGYASISWAVPVTFIYDSTTNASAVGGSSEEAVNITFTFDNNILNGTGSFAIDSNHGSYGSWAGTLRIGSEIVELTGGDIFLWNDVTNSSGASDGYDFRWDRNYASSLYEGTSSGTLFGSNLDFFRVLIVDDQNYDMLSSVNLPTDPSFALKGAYIQDDYMLSDGRYFGLSEYSGPGRDFTLSSAAPAPEPATMLLFGSGLAGLVGMARRRMKV